MILLLAGASAALAQPTPALRAGFPTFLAGDFVRSGAVALADLTGDGQLEIIVGGSDGILHAYDRDGDELWTYQAETAGGQLIPIEGKAAVGDVDGDGLPEVVFGAGSTNAPSSSLTGALFVLNHLGQLQCRHNNTGTALKGVYSSPALADLDNNDGGKLEIAYGSWDHRIRALHHDCTLLWEVDAFDTVWPSPAIGDINGDGLLEVVIGAASTEQPMPIGTEDGGRLFALHGATGANLPGFPIQIDEAIQSSPALGDINGDGHLDIVVGTGNCWGSGNINCGNPQHPGVGEYVNAWDRFGQPLPGWPVATPGRYTFGSPALADIDDDGVLEVVINAAQRNTGPPLVGWVYVPEGNGTIRPGWPKSPSVPGNCTGLTSHSATPASPVIADLVGDDRLEILLPSGRFLVMWDRDGNQLTRPSLHEPGCVPPAGAGTLNLEMPRPINGTPAIGDVDNDGTLTVIAAGYQFSSSSDAGALTAWELTKTGSPATPWPVFRQSQDNRADFSAPPFFADGFESGSTSEWSDTVP